MRAHTIGHLLRRGLGRFAASAFLVSSLIPVAARSVAQDKYADRARRAGEVLAELTKVPDRAPPTGLLQDATCIAVVPRVIEGGFGFGGEAGFGLASCRTSAGWSLPTFMGLKGGSFGLQIGGEATDVVLVFMNQDAPEKIARSTFDLGGDASVAAGPVGRDVAAATDYRAQAEIYSYSKSKGAFAGLKLTGTKWEIDASANREVYHGVPAFDSAAPGHAAARLLATPAGAAPATVQPFVESLTAHVDHKAGD